ncbi:MAG: hypothetical protein WKF40_09545 [Thermoleophilaceae bacterium]
MITSDLVDLQRRRARRRRVLQRGLPLGARPRRACSPACTRRCGPALRSSAQCGGDGNIERLPPGRPEVGASASPIARYLAGLGRAVELRVRREHGRAAGAAPASSDVQTLAGAVAGRSARSRATFLRAVCLGHHLDALPEGACATHASLALDRAMDSGRAV